MAVFYALPALTNGFQGFYRGMGKMTTTLIGTCLQAGLRALGAALLAPASACPVSPMPVPSVGASCSALDPVLFLHLHETVNCEY